MLTLLVTSPRVAPGLLSWQAWTVLREASRVLAGSAGHPLIPALTEAGVAASVVTAPAQEPDLASFLASAATAADGPVVWLMPPGPAYSGVSPSGSESSPGASLSSLLRSLSAATDVPVQVVHGSRELPGSHLLDLVAIMDTLRVSCPWDREQTHASLLKYLLEETYEAAEAIETSDWASLREELGDVLFQAVFHSRVAAERSAAEGGFTIDDVADELAAKLVRRHPHVFGSVAVSSADDVNRNWEAIKKAEKAAKAARSGDGGSGGGPVSVLDGVAFGQPALSLAAQLWRRAQRAGAPVAEFAGSDGDPSGPSGDAADALGAELMRVIARAQATGTDPELALRDTARRFADQVRSWEDRHHGM